ncbi:MAG: polymer-forming cytoskeletal protein [bacterium]|nr:polymer-forming cytoskeletal protein [bacterium]MBK8128485.1 polymer-forming cytoskeletal protein [bacterium]
MAKWTRFTASENFAGEMSTLLAKDAEINGTLRTQGSLRIDGRVSGDVFCAKMVTIGSSGSVDGNIQAESIIVAGRVKGSLVAKQKVHLEATAELIGDLSAGKLSIQEGARVRGHTATDETSLPSSRPVTPTTAESFDDDASTMVPRNRPVAAN